MATLVHDTTVIATVQGRACVLHHYSFAFADGRIAELGPATGFETRLDEPWDTVIHAEHLLVSPGFVNTHHHLYQAITRCLPSVQNERLFAWLRGLYPHWRTLDYRAVNVAAKVSIAELLLSGCTTTSDHHYMFPPRRDVQLEAVLDAATELGIRIHLCRGSMTLGAGAGGLPPDDCVEQDTDVVADCVRVLDAYHDPYPFALRRIDLAPCSPFNVSRELMRDTRALARERGVLLHTHLAETLDEERFCVERYGCRPVQFLADLDWLGPDVYLAHCVHLSPAEITQLADTNTGVSHNPTSNLRLASSIAPATDLCAAGVRVGLGVDGASSNDGGSILAAAKVALLSARHRMAESLDKPAPELPTPQFAFDLATSGGAACLGRAELGHLSVGAAADFAMFPVDDIALAGAVAHDPLAALVLCDAPRPDRVYVAGREVVRDGRLTMVDEHALANELNTLVRERFA